MISITALFIEKWDAEGYLAQLTSHLIKIGVQVKTERMIRQRYDVLHLHIPYAYKYISIESWIRFIGFGLKCCLLKIQGKRIVWTAHDLFDKSGKRKRLIEVWIYMLSRFADKIFCHALSSKEQLIREFSVAASKIVLVPHPSFIGLFPQNATREEARSLLGIPNDKFVYLLLGNLYPYKGSRRFLKALDNIQQQDAIFIAAGRPSAKEEIEFLRNEAVKRDNFLLFPEFVAADKLQFFFAAADIAVFPYEQITTSGAVVLAMSFAKPVIAVNMSCLGEVVHPEGGICYEADDPRGLENALLRARQLNHAELNKMGQYNFELASKHTWDNLAAVTKQTYESLVNL